MIQQQKSPDLIYIYMQFFANLWKLNRQVTSPTLHRLGLIAAGDPDDHFLVGQGQSEAMLP